MSHSPANSSNIVCFGEILWDILPDKAVPGGAPMNVAYHLHQLGDNPLLYTRVGVDERGKALLDILAKKGINAGFVQLDYDTPTGIVHAKANEEGEMSYDIVSPAAWDHIAADSDSEQAVQNAAYFVYGSLIARHSTSRNTLFRMLEIAKNKVLDINLRTPYFTRSLVEQLLGKADMLKMNIAELELITGWFTDFKDTRARIELIQDRFNIPSVIVTMGGDGALINFKGSWYSHPGFKVKVADTIGSGDSFLAAFLSSVSKESDPAKALKFASGLGALVASRTGGWPEYTINEILTDD